MSFLQAGAVVSNYIYFLFLNSNLSMIIILSIAPGRAFYRLLCNLLQSDFRFVLHQYE